MRLFVLKPQSARTILTVLALTACAKASARSPSPAPSPAPAPPAAAPQAAGGRQDSAPPRGQGQAGQPRPYGQVITAEAKTQTGLFKVHRIGERLYYEIPRRELNKDQLFIRRAIGGGGGSANMIVQWQRVGNRILLRQYSYGVVADSGEAIHGAVEPLMQGGLIATFNVETWGPDSAPVVEATKLFTTGIPELQGPNGQFQSDRSWIETVGVYPTNVEVEALQTALGQPAGPTFPGAPPGRQVTNTGRYHWSMLRLPEQKMMPRLHDERIGFISTQLIDYGLREHRSPNRRYIHRFRVEKKDPNASLSEPVKPIVFYIDPATPAWLVPWVKKGIDDWQPAFEQAGFRNAIVGKEVPSKSEDPNFSIHDARHSIIYWRASTTENASGGQTVDPRTGEIMKAEVNMFHNVMNLVRRWYFVQVGPLDPRAQRLPFPDSLIGRLVEYVVAHEVGHAIGFPHNMKASSQYPADSLRSASFLRRMGGHVATLMDYSRFNYVAQPEDNIPLDLLVPGVGPYDKFVVMWGHTPIPNAKTPDEEKATLERWSRMQDTVPWYRYETPGIFNDPGSLTEAVGDADAVKSTTLALKNLKRVVALLRPVHERAGENYAGMRESFDEVVSQWGRYMAHVAAVVGGAESQEKYGTGQRFYPVSAARQRGALRFLNENAFATPSFLVDRDILLRIEPEGVIGRIRNAQNSVISALVSDARLNRLIEYEALAGKGGDAYTAGDMLKDLRSGVWGEVTKGGTVTIDVYRRNLQRAYLEAVGARLQPPAAPTQPAFPGLPPQPPRFTTDTRPLLRGELIELDRAIAAALGRTTDNVTRLHLQDARHEIEAMLEKNKK